MKDIAGTLSFGAIYTGWVKWLMIFLFVSSLALMIFASIIAFVLDSEMLIVGAISALFSICFFIPIAINFKNCKRIKECLKDAVRLKAFARAISTSMTHTLVFRQRTTKLAVSFEYNNKTVVMESGKKDVPCSIVNGYSSLFNKYANKELTILYSPRYNEVIILKESKH